MKKVLYTLILAAMMNLAASGHPLGIFSINRYTKIEIAGSIVRLQYIVDIAEIPTTQEFKLIDKNNDGIASPEERHEYAAAKAEELAKNILLDIDGKQMAIQTREARVSFSEGQGGLKTTRLEVVYETSPLDKREHDLFFHDGNYAERKGWKEIVASASSGVIEESSVPDHDVTDGLRLYPQEMVSRPVTISDATVHFVPGERVSALSGWTQSIVSRTGDAFADLISTRELSTSIMLLSLLIAMALGAGHALTPGHGKTIVGAYLVGSRGTAKHAAILGLTVTITHTLGVFALGLVALFASQYVLPEQLFPWLSLVSGLMVIGIGLSLLKSRLSLAMGTSSQAHTHDHHTSGIHAHLQGDSNNSLTHTHDGHTHTHALPGADGLPVTWKTLVAIGISGGLLPCPSAIVVLLSAVAIGRIGFGLLLIVAFSAGLAGVLTGIGLLMVYSQRYFQRFNMGSALFRWLPVLSATVVSAAGVFLSIEAFGQTGLAQSISAFFGMSETSPTAISGALQVGVVSILGLGFVLGLKHALDADHIVAVSTIVSERKGFLSSSLVGALWGLGHTASLFIVGCIVIALHIMIPDRVAMFMEFCVAGMLVVLGFNVLWKLNRIRQNGELHVHSGHLHFPPHAHEPNSEGGIQTHHHSGIAERLVRFAGSGKRSILVGMVHGMAGSAALMLIVLAAIPSRTLALAYIGIFGVGSIGGMLIMSTIVGLPFVFTAGTSASVNKAVRGLAGTISVVFGLFLAYQIGVVDGLFIR